jgi:hypothetical protein
MKEKYGAHKTYPDDIFCHIRKHHNLFLNIIKEITGIYIP